MKLFLFLSLLCTNLQPGVDSTTKAEPKKKQTTTPKPASKKTRSGLPFVPVIIDFR